MLRIVLEVDAPLGHAIGVKESLAHDVEKYGDTRVVSVTELGGEQLSLPLRLPMEGQLPTEVLLLPKKPVHEGQL